MFNVLVVSHGSLSKIFLETAAMIFGDLDDGVGFLSFRPGESADELLDGIRKKASRGSEAGGTLVLCDLLGGSPFLMSARVYAEQSTDAPVEVVCGLNLGMLIEILSERGEKTLGEGKAIAVEAGKGGVQDLSSRLFS